MRSIFRRILSFILILFLLTFTAAWAGNAAIRLKGAKTYNLMLQVHTGRGCEVDQSKLMSGAFKLFEQIPRLRWVTEEAVPDLVIEVNIDISPLPGGDSPVEICNYVGNVRAIHPIFGALRYAPEPRLIQAFLFNTTLFSVVHPSIIQQAIEYQLQRGIQFFIDEYALGNK